MASHHQAAIDRLIQARKDAKEDARAAVLIALDASKSLITIAIAFFAALGAFVLNYRASNQASFSWPMALLGLSAVMTIASMIAGFNAVGKAYKRAQKGPDAEGLQWATRPLAPSLGAQSLLGLAALVCFGLAVVFWEARPSTALEAQVTRLQQTLDDLVRRVDRQAGELTLIQQNAATATGDLGRRLGQQGTELARIDQAAAANAQAVAAIPALERRLTEIAAGLAEIRGRLPQP